jgi:acetyl esterase/lipase
MILGDRFGELDHFLPWITELDATVATVEYRHAPEHPDPYPVQDCCSGLCWMGENLRSLGIDPERLLIAGSSAGGAVRVFLLVPRSG